MRHLSYILVTIAIIAAGGTAFAGTCPVRADSLEAFKNCMVPMKNTIGMTTVYSSGKYDRDNAQLMSAMMRSQIVPSHSMPASVVGTYPYYGYFSPVSMMNLYFAGHSSYRNNWVRFAAYYSPYYRYSPSSWIYAYYNN